MLTLKTANDSYKTIEPIILGSSGVTDIAIKTKLSEYRELDLTINQNLNHAYNFLKSNSESRLLLDIENNKIGFFKSSNIITHLLVIGNSGAGTDGNTCIFLDNINASYIDSDYPLDPLEFNYIRNNKAFYIKNQDQLNVSKKYYEIKVFTTQSNAENTTNDNDSIIVAQAKLYTEAISFLKENNEKLSIDQQINKLNGVSEIHFYSSSLEIKKNKRVIDTNLAYDGSAINLLNQLSNDFVFINLTVDEIIKIQTGIIDNYDLLCEICKKAGWQWREKTINSQNKTVIEVGNFNLLQPKDLTTNILQDNWFFKQKSSIKQVRELYPTLDIDLQINKFYLEGDKFNIRYIENIKNQYGVKVDTINIRTLKVFQGYLNSIDLYNFL